MIIRTCSIMKLTTSEELVEQAYVIVQAKAVDYEKRPDDSDWSTDITSSPIIRFKVEEIIKGIKNIPNTLLINGYLNQYDDFNDHPPPYNFVRPNGRFGSCFANTYKQNASFLLFLNNEYTPYWDSLTPVNEQLHSPPFDDKWLQWVKQRVAIDIHGRSINQVLANRANKLRPFFF